jgi:transposase
MKKIREVIRLRLSRKASVRQIAAACNIGRTTVSEYLARIEAGGLVWPAAGELGEEELRALLFPPEPQLPGPARPVPDWQDVHRELSRKGVTLKLLWQEYDERTVRGYSYSRYVRLYRAWQGMTDLRMLQAHKAGEKLFVDWAGQTLGVADPKTGEVRQAHVFVAAMGASQYVFAKVYESEQLKSWLGGHVDAFEFFGALPEVVVPDNLKTGVERACRYEPALNPSYADLAQFYGLTVLPARVRKPRDKAKVENAVQQVERWVLAPLRDRRFLSLSEANEAIAGQLAELNSKVMKGPNTSRRQLFERVDLPAMRPLTPSRFVYAEWKRAKVAPDYHVEVEGRLYSVPFTLVGEHVDVRISAGTVEVFSKGKRVASHLRSISRRGFTTDDAHMPEHHKRQGQWSPARIIRWAGIIGPQTAAFASALLEGKLHPEHGYRMCMGVMSLEKRFGSERLEAACSRALGLGALSYQSVKSILHKNLEGVNEQQVLPGLPSHENVRGGAYFAKEAPCAN